MRSAHFSPFDGQYRLRNLMKHLRFDHIDSRRARKKLDNFGVISNVRFIDNCHKCCIPNFDRISDEQCFPCKSRCPFVQYIASKRDKFGIKFWLLVDAKSQHLCNGKPYLRRDYARHPAHSLSVDVCLWLMSSYLKKIAM